MTPLLTAAGLLVGVLAAATLPGISAGRIAPASALRIERPRRPQSTSRLAFRSLPWEEERLDQFAFATHGHSRKPLVPLALGHIGLRVEPRRE
jgi:hypothetical protein